MLPGLLRISLFMPFFATLRSQLEHSPRFRRWPAIEQCVYQSIGVLVTPRVTCYEKRGEHELRPSDRETTKPAYFLEVSHGQTHDRSDSIGFPGYHGGVDVGFRVLAIRLDVPSSTSILFGIFVRHDIPRSTRCSSGRAAGDVQTSRRCIGQSPASTVAIEVEA